MLHHSIDLDRGVISATHPSLNMDIFMYVDAPGKYLTAHGDKVDKKLAREAGFDVDKYEKDRVLNDALEQAEREIREKMDAVSGIKTIATRNGFKIMDIGLGRCNVLGPEGDLLNKEPLTEAQAKILLDHLAPKDKDKK